MMYLIKSVGAGIQKQLLVQGRRIAFKQAHRDMLIFQENHRAIFILEKRQRIWYDKT